MKTKDKDQDELDKFIIGEMGIEGYLESNPEFLKTKLAQLLSESILHLRKYIENPKEKDITWDNPYIGLKYKVEYPDNDSELPLITYPEQKTFDRVFHSYPLSFLLREITDYIIIFKEGDKTEIRISAQNRHLKELTGVKREEYFRELGEKHFSDNKEPTFTLPFKLEFPDDKGPKRKPLSGSLFLDIRPLWVDMDSREANYTVTARLDIKEYKPTQWSKEEKKEFWEALDKELKTYAPQESFDFLEKLIEPEVKPIIKKRVYKQSNLMAKATLDIFTNIGLKDDDFIGYTKERGKDEAKWRKEKITALVLIKDLPLLDQGKKKDEGQGYLIPTPPNTTVSQEKSLDTLCYMLQEEDRRREKTGQDKTGNLDFSLEEFAKMRGKSDAQIAQAGSYLNELKRDLISGGVTSYIVDLEATTGRKSYLIQNFYGLEIPKAKSKRKWRIIFNEPYKTDILNSRQYFPVDLDAIQDPNTNGKKGYLYFFYKVVKQYASNKPHFSRQLKVSTLLDYIKVGDRTKDRPKEAFKVLCECIYYTVINRKGTIKEVRFFDSGKCEKVKSITDLEKFARWDYDDFKNEALNHLDLTDIREALISFNNTRQKELTEVTEEPKQIGEYKTTL